MSREERIQKQLDFAQQITHIGSWEWDVATNQVLWSDELYRIYGLEPQSCEITFDSFLARVHPGDRERTVAEVRAAIAHGGRFAYPERILRPDGSMRELQTMGEAVRDDSKKVIRLVGTCRDVTEERELGDEVRLYADLVAHVQLGLSVWKVGDAADPRTFTLLAFNAEAERLARLPLQAQVGRALPDILPYARGGALERLLASVAREGGVHETAVYRSNDPTDPTRAVAMKAFPLPGGRIGLTTEDITQATRARLLREAEQLVFERIAAGVELSEILDAIARLAEDHARPALVSILLVDADGKHVRHGAAPSLPDAYVRAIDGAEVGPKAGSCGTAVWRRAPVYVSDVRIDPLWENYRTLADTFGLRACWSSPIFARDGRVLGTFALYYRDARAPSEEDKALIARATEIAGIAIQRHQLESQLRELSARAERAREEERAAIARELHDVLGQAMTALKLDLGWIARRAAEDGEFPRAALLEKVRTMSELSDEIIADTRRISSELRPGLLDTFGLLAAFEWQAQKFSERTGTPCDVQSNIGDVRLDRESSTALFRVLQEALTNVVRHAEATRVTVTLDRSGDSLKLEVRDDGRGITKEQAEGSHSLGLLGIRERARRLGGFAVIAGEAGAGTLVAVTVPFREG
jgi:PAS domain S-box-containing protein